MTIDEVIARTREVAKIMYERSKEYSLYSDECFECEKCAEEHEQLAEWLEELKNNRIALEKANGYLEANHKLGYDKGVDDFVNSCKENIVYKTFGLREIDIEKIAKQLKEGIKE